MYCLKRSAGAACNISMLYCCRMQCTHVLDQQDTSQLAYQMYKLLLSLWVLLMVMPPITKTQGLYVPDSNSLFSMWTSWLSAIVSVSDICSWLPPHALKIFCSCLPYRLPMEEAQLDAFPWGNFTIPEKLLGQAASLHTPFYINISSLLPPV